ncbi:MAG: alpha/beta hydrolase, partial [Nostocaceae cyanobacterium]|nr:alpha/beta hydrolase [Nostocaceae cyanobacterium]
MKPYKWLGTALGSLTLSLLSNTLTATSGLAAEQLVFSYPPFGDFEISTNDLEIFAKQGKITDNFAYYAKRVNSKQREQLRELLQNRFTVTPTLVSQFFYTPLGETVLKRLGEIFETDSRMNGFYALRSAFILAAADPEGLTAINVLRRYPTRSL